MSGPRTGLLLEARKMQDRLQFWRTRDILGESSAGRLSGRLASQVFDPSWTVKIFFWRVKNANMLKIKGFFS
jgi:hypothetical protein